MTIFDGSALSGDNRGNHSIYRAPKWLRVAERWVINASPVIALSRVGQIELLVRLPQQSVIPRSAADELLRAPEDDPARHAMEGGICQIVATPAPPAQTLAWDLVQGEIAVLSYELASLKRVAVLDDGAARRCAPSLSLKINGIWESNSSL